MAEYQAYTCDSVGNVYDRIPFEAANYSSLLSAGDSGSSITIPLDGTFTKTEMRNHFRSLSRIIAIENNRKIEYLGYITGKGYQRGKSLLTLPLRDVWFQFPARFAFNHNHPNVAEWSEEITGSLAYQGARAIEFGRTGPASPTADMPVTLPGGYPGASSTRPFYGYMLERVDGVLTEVMDSGLDIFMRPRWATIDSQVDWVYEAGPAWGSGISHEFFVTAEQSGVVAFSETEDALRVTNNAYRVGEGSEVDMLVRSNRNLTSLYPLRESATMSKTVTKADQLNRLVNGDLSIYEHPTVQWQFAVSGDHPITVGDTARLYFNDDLWIADGWHERRVVKVDKAIPGPNIKTISVQPTGGA